MDHTLYKTGSLRCGFCSICYNGFVSKAGLPRALHLEVADQLDPGAGAELVVSLAVHVVRGLLGHQEGQFGSVVDRHRLLRLPPGTLVTLCNQTLSLVEIVAILRSDWLIS